MAGSTKEVPDTFRTLADPVRRYVLYYLVDQEAPATLYCLATRVAGWHTDCVPLRSWNEFSASSRGIPGG